MKNKLFQGLNFARSLTSTLLRTGTGISSEPRSTIPDLMLRLYDIESCPYCRLVREACTELDLDVEIYPCPKDSLIYRDFVKATGGKLQFPFLVDPNNGTQMYESMDIVAYLFKVYSDKPLPLKWQFGTLQKISSIVAGIPRSGEGTVKAVSLPPSQLLELYSFESSPFARIVRECLCEMEIPYIVRNCGRTELSEWLVPVVRDLLNSHPNSKLNNRKILQERTGRMSIPYLYDPNTQIGLYESADIVEYLKCHYGR
jgi:glutathione S-transferase